MTIPNSAAHGDWAAKYVQFLLGASGQSTMTSNGFGGIGTVYVNDVSKVPSDLKPLVVTWQH